LKRTEYREKDVRFTPPMHHKKVMVMYINLHSGHERMPKKQKQTPPYVLVGISLTCLGTRRLIDHTPRAAEPTQISKNARHRCTRAGSGWCGGGVP
jgi:hypothetical protein